MPAFSSLLLRAVPAAAVLALTLAASASAALPRWNGVQMHPMWQDLSPSDTAGRAKFEADLDKAKSLGANHIRLDVGWSTLQGGAPAGATNAGKSDSELQASFWPAYVARLDYVMGQLQARGMKGVITLWYTPCWASSAPDALKTASGQYASCDSPGNQWWTRAVDKYPPSDPQEYARIAAWMAKRYSSGLAGLEVWNEPDLEPQFGGCGSACYGWWRGASTLAQVASQYADLLAPAYQAIKAAAPHVPVLATGMSASDFAFLDFLYATGKFKGSFDALSLHPYTGGLDPLLPPPSTADKWSFKYGIEKIRARMAANGDPRPLWLSEWGWSSQAGGISEATVSSYFAKALGELRDRQPGILGQTIYQFQDTWQDPADSEANYGMLRYDGIARPYAAPGGPVDAIMTAAPFAPAAPDTAIGSGPDGAPSSPSFSFSAPGALFAAFECKLDAGAWGVCVSPQPYAGLADGPHTFQVRAVGEAGAADLTPASRSFTVDASAPDTQIDMFRTGAASASLAFSASQAGSSFECKLDEGGWTPCASPQPYAGLADGPHTFQVRARSAAGAADPSPAPASWTAAGLKRAPAAGHLRVAIGSAPAWPDVALSASRSDIFILQAWETARRDQIKAANPSAKVLVYKNLSAMTQGRGPGGLSSSGVNYDEAATAHPDWFLLSTSGQRFTFSGYGFLWAADIGSTGYQQRWAANVAAELNSGWDGVFMDDANATIKYHYAQDQVAAYPTESAYGAAMKSMVQAVTARIRPAGKLAFANMLMAEHPAASRDWLGMLDGAMDEMFGKWDASIGGGYRGEAGWQEQVDNLAWAEAHDKSVLAVTQGASGDQQAARYGWASALLAGEGRTRWALHDGYETESWRPEYGYALGAPAGPASRDANGIRRRAFASGLVLVNPTSFTLNASLGGSYSGSGLAAATSATLPPNTGLVLTKDVAAHPDAAITGAPAAATSDPTADFTFTSTDPAGAFECKVDAEAWGACTSPHATATLPDGAHIFSVRAIDQALNADPAPAIYAFVVDTIAPDTAISAGPSGPGAAAAASFAFASSEAGSSFQCQLDGSAWSACTSPKAFADLAAGPHSFHVRAVDAAGNPDATPAARTWTVSDRQDAPPSVELASPPAGSFFGPRLALAARASDDKAVAKVEFLLDGRVIATDGSAPYAASLRLPASTEYGPHLLAARAVDSAGQATQSPAASAARVRAADLRLAASPAGGASSGRITGRLDGARPGGIISLLVQWRQPGGARWHQRSFRLALGGGGRFQAEVRIPPRRACRVIVALPGWRQAFTLRR